MDSLGMIKSEVLEQLLSIERRLREIEASLEGIPQISQLTGQKIAYEHVLKLLDVHAEYQVKMQALVVSESETERNARRSTPHGQEN